MRKFKLFVTTTVLLSLMAMAFVSKPTSAFAAQKVDYVGFVTAYTPGESITILDADGNQFTFKLAAGIKTVPHDQKDLLVLGAYVTIFSLDGSLATSIVIHPQPPAGSAVPKEPVKGTPSPVESPTEKVTVTATPVGTETSTETATPKATLPGESLTPTGTQTVKSPPKDAPTTDVSFIEWLASIFKKLLASGS